MGLISKTKNSALPLLKQIIDLIPVNIVNSARAKYNTDKYCRTYKDDADKTIVVISNNLDWSASTIAGLYKRRWAIELFFKAMKQNLQIKTFIGTNENACKSQIYIALIAYYLLELIRRSISKVKHTFSQFVNLIRICLGHYHSLKYVVNEIQPISRKAKKYGSTGAGRYAPTLSMKEQIDLYP